MALCWDIADSGWAATVSARASECLTARTWNALFGKRRQADCEALAELAQSIHDGKDRLHELIGRSTSLLAEHSGGGKVERATAQELAERFPLPLEDQATLVARGLQMIGVAACLSNGVPLDRCQSFIDLSWQETKNRVRRLMTVTLEEWAEGNTELVDVWAGHPAAQT